MVSFEVLKRVTVQLVPFFSAVGAFFMLWDDTSFFVVWKCLPVICLLVFVHLNRLNGSKDQPDFSRRIFIALVFCFIGDACLVWDHLFVFGMIAFGVGHVFYIRAFGFQPLNLPLGISFFALAAYAVSIWVDRLPSIVLLIGVPIYVAILTTMAWRATARARFSGSDWTWTHIATSLGAVSFCISDGFIGFDRFHSKIPHAEMWIMITYYAAQLGLALSVVDVTNTRRRGQPKRNLSTVPKQFKTKSRSD